MSEYVSHCPKCRQRILCSSQYSGQRVACPLCLQEIIMPGPPEAGRATAPVPAADVPPAPGQQAASGKRVPLVAVVGGVVLLLAAGGGIWAWQKSHSTSVPPPPVAPAPVAVAPVAPIPVVATPVVPPAQNNDYIVDQFKPAGRGGYSYAKGQISSVWGNWFGSAFQSLSWDASNAGDLPRSGSLKINANFTPSQNQYVVHNALAGINPPLNGQLFATFQCDVRFAAGSATTVNGGITSFGHLQFGVSSGSAQYYFGSIEVPEDNTNWVHVSLPISAADDTNLLQISDVLIHIYGPFYRPGMTGASTLWVDNIQFNGPR